MWKTVIFYNKLYKFLNTFFVSVSTCKERWHQLVREYKNCQNVLTLHEVTFELLRECIREDSQRPNTFFEEIEDDVLVKLFSEPLDANVEDPIALSFSIENIDRDMEIAVLNEDHLLSPPEALPIENQLLFSGYNDYCESDTELMDEASCLPCCDPFFIRTNDLHDEDIRFSPDQLNINDIFYNGEDVQDYYNFYMENNLNEFPMIFDDVVESLLDHLDEDAGDEVRGDIVKLLCDRVGKQKLQRRQ